MSANNKTNLGFIQKEEKSLSETMDEAREFLEEYQRNKDEKTYCFERVEVKQEDIAHKIDKNNINQRNKEKGDIYENQIWGYIEQMKGSDFEVVYSYQKGRREGIYDKKQDLIFDVQYKNHKKQRFYVQCKNWDTDRKLESNDPGILLRYAKQDVKKLNNEYIKFAVIIYITNHQHTISEELRESAGHYTIFLEIPSYTKDFKSPRTKDEEFDLLSRQINFFNNKANVEKLTSLNYYSSNVIREILANAQNDMMD